MRIDKNCIVESDGTGYIKMTTEEEDDIWDVYVNLKFGNVLGTILFQSGI